MCSCLLICGAMIMETHDKINNEGDNASDNDGGRRFTTVTTSQLTTTMNANDWFTTVTATHRFIAITATYWLITVSSTHWFITLNTTHQFTTVNATHWFTSNCNLYQTTGSLALFWHDYESDELDILCGGTRMRLTMTMQQ